MSVSTQLHNAKARLWMERITDQKASGLHVKDWCESNNLTTHAFYYWKRILKEHIASGDRIPDIVPILVNDSSVEPTPVSLPVPSQSATTIPSCVNSSNSRDLCNLSDSRDLHNSRKLYNSADSVTISTNGVNIELSANASDEMLLRIIQAVRHV